ncbi:hypothetical protein CTAYLR_005054 [Chrysophaeum taylorii]|uniref:Intron-binding protein aquarius n=1 Tax=Chrysophaeum taylorii TaxID=2483200 RepID=A0AAD7XJS1_9STRA|nr:hypothetical protein CTAYLR_005054 [Chrysophaeum taylorii]
MEEVSGLIERWQRGGVEDVDGLIVETYAAMGGVAARVEEVEYAQYLEAVLWPRWCGLVKIKAASSSSQRELVLSIVLMVNEKARARTLAWAVLLEDKKAFAKMFEAVTSLSDFVDYGEREAVVGFLAVCFGSLEHATVRKVALRLVSLPLWASLSPARRERELAAFPELARRWAAASRNTAAKSAERTYVPSLVEHFLGVINIEDEETVVIPYARRCLELFADLLAQLPTRRFARAVLVEARVLEKCALSRLAAKDALFAKLLDAFGFYVRFPLDDQTGLAPSRREAAAQRREAFDSLRRAAFSMFRHERFADALAFGGSTRAVSERAVLEGILSEASGSQLLALSRAVGVPCDDSDDRALAVATLSEACRRPSDDERPTSLLPTETVLWDAEALPQNNSPETPVAGPFGFPKLNLQFLTIDEYLTRNLALYRLEAAYAARLDVVDAVKRLKPVASEEATRFGGWARRARPLLSPPTVTRVEKPRLAKVAPARVECEVYVDLSGYEPDAAAEWDALRENEVLFLVGVDAGATSNNDDDDDEDCGFPGRYGVVCVRGAFLLKLEKDGDTGRRKLALAFDPAQYLEDRGDPAIYGALNMIVRREAKENNFAAVLETIGDLLETSAELPAWLSDVLLGYGDPAAAHYSQVVGPQHRTLDMADTFLDARHVADSFPFRKKEAVEIVGSGSLFRLSSSSTASVVVATAYEDEKTTIMPTAIARASAALFGEPRRNKVRFTPAQVEAIVDGMLPGLAMIRGPPGTGKTDVAVQIVANLVRAYPNERTLVVAHSNAALNDLFAKIVERDVDSRLLVRLGAGALDLDVDEATSYTRLGRVEAVLERRQLLLDEVQRLAHALGGGNPDYAAAGDACETARYFDVAVLTPRLAVAEGTAAAVREAFGFFAKYFGDDTLFDNDDPKIVAKSCLAYARRLFDEVARYEAFELLRSRKQRSDYLLTKQARVIALTCTHAALARRDLVALGLRYDTLVVEEAAQILEIETFIPLVLQTETSRLKRIVLIGDDRQLPPVVKHRALAAYARLDQSMFARLARLGFPILHLDAQGRARPSIADLYRWRYPYLRDLPEGGAAANPYANPGFVFEYQFVDVRDRSETSPTPHFYQNLAEAEYVVATFMYMRLLGYPAHTISILAAYNGQKHLIRDVLRRRCEFDPLFGLPAALATVDKYQGHQNDYVLVSLVRTRRLGYLRDVRRLVVAVSRSKLGLYVFGCRALFETAPPELKPTFDLFFARPTALTLAIGDPNYSAPFYARNLLDPPPSAHAIRDCAEMSLLVYHLKARRHPRIAPPPPPPPPPSSSEPEEAELVFGPHLLKSSSSPEDVEENGPHRKPEESSSPEDVDEFGPHLPPPPAPPA